MTLGLKRDLFDTAVKDLLKSGAIDENDAKRFLKTLVYLTDNLKNSGWATESLDYGRI